MHRKNRFLVILRKTEESIFTVNSYAYFVSKYLVNLNFSLIKTMAAREMLFPFPTRVQEEVRIYNLSLPMQPVSSNEPGYEPELVDLLRAVECPVCRCIPNPPIYNCLNGHFCCASCRPRLPFPRCAYCLAKFTKMRNYPLENLVASRVFICDFRSAGCKVKGMNMSEYEEHMKKCWFSSLVHQESPLPPPNSTVANSNEFNCPRCNFMNSKRKLKCQNCQTNLRAPTPMCSRPPWAGNHGICSTDSL